MESPLTPAVRTLFATWTAELAAGSATSLDELCTRHPEASAALRALGADFERTQHLLGALGARLSAAELVRRSMEGVQEPASSEARLGLLERLVRHRPGESRYEVRSEIARGGMGAILEAYDGDLRRRLAMKVIKPSRDAAASSPEPAVLHRFLEEAQITAQLSHPGVVPVHELGVDGDGRVFFTMAMVQGEDLARVFDRVERGTDGWNETRALNVVLKVCETLAFAHTRGVIHRDIKPQNVMVGSFGEVYVMDWGLAKLLGEPEAERGPRISSERLELAAEEESSSLLTLDGGIVGTPSFMSPEQARGEELDARSDVYAVGALLYNLLTGSPPYAAAHGKSTPEAIVLAIRKGPPLAIGRFGRKPSMELVSIAEKAMARDRELRFATTLEMAEDLRRFLEGRVVRAHRTGALVEFTKWIRRNRGTAAALAGLIVAVIGGLSFTLWLQARARERAQVLTDGKVVPYLFEQEKQLWPPYGSTADAIAAWIADARGALGRRDAVERLERELATRGRPLAEAGGRLQFDDVQIGAQHQLLLDLEARLDALPERVGKLEERLAFARTIEERSMRGADAVARWAAARRAIAASEKYGGLELSPQLGLLPLGPDPASGLWEFWHVQSGEEPARDTASGQLAVGPASGIVLVLVPGGMATMGSKAPTAEKEAGEPYTYAEREQDEHFYAEIALDPFLLSKYETTQAQWERTMEANPSQKRGNLQGYGALYPVDDVSREDCEEAAHRWRLSLPTEAQWEYACRAGSTGSFCFDDDEEFEEFVNYGDESAAAAGVIDASLIRQGKDDGHAFGAPVGSMRANAFGLHEMHGNAWEWCRDDFLLSADPRPRDGDGLRVRASGQPEGSIRGGSWSAPWWNCSAPNRMSYHMWNHDGDLGARFARVIEP